MAPKKKVNKKNNYSDEDEANKVHIQTTQTNPSTAATQNTLDANQDEDGNDLGGLMATLQKSRNQKKNKNKNKQNWNEDGEDEDSQTIMARLDKEEALKIKMGEVKTCVQPYSSKVSAQTDSSIFAALMMDDEQSTQEDSESQSEVNIDEESIATVQIRESQPLVFKKKKKKDKIEEDVELLMLQMEESKNQSCQVKMRSKGKGSTPSTNETVNSVQIQGIAAVEEDNEVSGRIKSKKEKEKERKERQKLAKKDQDKKDVIKYEKKNDSNSKDVSQSSAAATTAVQGKPVKMNSHLAALKQALAIKKQQEEDRLKLIEEEEAQEHAANLLLELEEAQKEEQRKLKKEREKLKKEELKKCGKYLTSAQKKQQIIDKSKLEILLRSGVIVEGMKGKMDEEHGGIVDESEIVKRKKVVYGKKKKVEVAIKEEKSSVVDNWDASDDDDIHVENAFTAEIQEQEETKNQIIDSDDEILLTRVANQGHLDITREIEKTLHVDDGSGEDRTAAEKQCQLQKKEALKRKEMKHDEAMAQRSQENLRSPIGCILGHVDTGKTKLLDRIRQTNVQEGEAGGITQQIGATYFPIEAIKTKTEKLNATMKIDYNIPGLLIIDTPGHESFTNLRSRGSSLCNIAILVVDIMHGLEPQTIESLNLLKTRKTPFIVALNKIDRIYGWIPTLDNPLKDSLAIQPSHVMKEYNDRVEKTVLAFAEQGLNSCLYYDNKNYAKNVSLVPTSAITGEGIPDMLNLLIHLCQSRMSEQLMYLSEVEATVLEVKVIEGLGTTIDVILSNGQLNEGDKIVVCGLNGPIVTTIRALLTPQPMRELRIKSAYVKHKTVKAALGVKISGADLEKAIAGSRLLVVGPDDDEEYLKDEVMSDLTNLMESIDKSGKGVCVQASTLGSLEALLVFLKDMKIPVSGINIGPVHKKDVIRASVMLERAREYAQLLAFDVPIDKDAELMAEEMGVKIFTADIIYHLFDSFKAYMAELYEQKRKDEMPSAVFPCILKIVPGAIFNKRSPLVIGVDVIEGQLRIGTPLCVMNEEKEIIKLGKVTGIQLNHKEKDIIKRGEPSVAIKIEVAHYESPRMFGRHFKEDDEVMSCMTRESIDILKTTFRNDLNKEEWSLVVKLKKKLNIE